GKRRRVETESCRRRTGGLVAGFSERSDRLVDDFLQFLGDARVVGLGHLVYPGDRGARQDVVELLQQDNAPDLCEALVGVSSTRPDICGGGPQFGLAQQVLAAPVARFGPCLGRVGAAVELEVQLARPYRWVRVVAFRVLKEGERGTQSDSGRAFQGLGPGRCREHFARRTAPAVAVPEGNERHVGCALLVVLALSPC